MSLTKCRWAFDVSIWEPNSSDWCTAMQMVQPEERDRIRRFKYRLDAKSSLVGRLMMQKWSKDYLEKQLTFSRSERGRPQCEDQLWDFNVSHQGKFTVFAAQKSDKESRLQIGVDVMRLSDERHQSDEKRDEFFRLMRRQFSDDEWIEIRNPQFFIDDSWTLGQRQLATFYRFWSLKESYVKAIGTGLNIDLRTLSFKINSQLSEEDIVTSTVLSVGNILKPEWTFEETLLDRDHCVSVATNQPQNEKFKFHQFKSIEEILFGLRPLTYQENFCDWSDYLTKHQDKKF